MRSLFPASTRARFALIIGVTLIPVISTTLFSYFRERRVLLAHVNEDVMRVTQTAAGVQEMAISCALQLLTALRVSIDKEDYQACAKLFSDVRNKNPIYVDIGLVLADGTLVGAGNSASVAGLVGRMNEEAEFALGIWNEDAGRKTGLILSYYCWIGSFGSKAALFVILDLKRLSGYTGLQLPHGAEYILVTENGTVLNVGPDFKGERSQDSPLIETILSLHEGTSEMKGLDGKIRLYAFRPLSGVADTGIYIAIGFPTSIYSEVDRILTFDLFVLALSLLAGLIIWGFVDRSVIRKVDVLVTTAQRLSGGEMKARTGLNVETSGEIDRIAQALDQMAETLENRTGQLYSYQEQLRSMASELLLVEERERRRIATEMHDRIGQALAISKIRLSALIKADTNQEAMRELGGIRKYIDQAILDTRSIIYKISSPILYELGLEAALEWLAEQVQKEHGVHSTFLSDGLGKPLDEDVRVLLFQAVSELLVNVVKHAHATKVEIRCKKDGDSIHIEVEDDGAGFNPEGRSLKMQCKSGFGLFSIRERLNYVKGKLEIFTIPGNGTVVTMKASLKDTRKS